MSVKLYVGNLSYQTSEGELNELFGQQGPVETVNVIMDKFTGQSKGFAFVTMTNPEDAQKAINALNGTKVNGREIRVNEARPQTDRPKGPRKFDGGGHSGKRNRY